MHTGTIETTFAHKQPVAFRRILVRTAQDGQRVFGDDWTETGTIRATKRDLRPLGYWLVRFDGDGGELCVHASNLRAA